MSAELVPVVVFCILNSLNQISLRNRKEDGGGGVECRKKDS